MKNKNIQNKSSWFKRAVAGTVLSFMVALAGLVTLVLNPQGLFAHQMAYEEFTVYSNFKIEKSELQGVLDQALKTVAGSELYDPTYRYELFFSHQTLYNEIDNLIFNPYAAARPTDNNIIIKVKTDLQRKLAYTDRSEIDLAYMLIHEMIHCLQENKYGKLKFNPFSHPPMWKLEGYPEYVARRDLLEGAAYDFVAEIERYRAWEKEAKTDRWIWATATHIVPAIYLKGRLLTEYLLDIKGHTYEELLDESFKEEVVYGEMLAWAASQCE